MNKLLRFSLVGGVGFLVDALSFYVLLEVVILAVNSARIWAFTLAMVLTWLGNRYLTFSQACRAKFYWQFCKHACSASCSFILNFMCFNMVLITTQSLSLAFVCGVSVAFVSNFWLSKSKVFI